MRRPFWNRHGTMFGKLNRSMHGRKTHLGCSRWIGTKCWDIQTPDPFLQLHGLQCVSSTVLQRQSFCRHASCKSKTHISIRIPPVIGILHSPLPRSQFDSGMALICLQALLSSCKRRKFGRISHQAAVRSLNFRVDIVHICTYYCEVRISRVCLASCQPRVYPTSVLSVAPLNGGLSTSLRPGPEQLAASVGCLRQTLIKTWGFWLSLSRQPFWQATSCPQGARAASHFGQPGQTAAVVLLSRPWRSQP